MCIRDRASPGQLPPVALAEVMDSVQLMVLQGVYVHEDVYKRQELTCMVRQLQPTDRGIPIELYFFCALKDWVPYEGVQALSLIHILL